MSQDETFVQVELTLILSQKEHAELVTSYLHSIVTMDVSAAKPIQEDKEPSAK